MAEGGENVVIAAGDCSVTILPSFGGKIASFRSGPHELLQSPLHPYGPRNQTMTFSESDAGGWDECLPSVAACSIDTPFGPLPIPDHGDLWRVPWQVLDTTSDSVTMRARSLSLPLELTRSMILSSTPSGSKLQILYSLISLGDERVPWSWSAHPLFACAKGDRIVLPSSIQSLRLEGSRGNRLGRNGDTIAWPLAQTAQGPLTNLSQADAEDSGTGDKLFAGPMTEGWCKIERASIGLSIGIGFDPAITPYLGLWLCYSGWPEADGPRQVCIAPEPATAPVDSLAHLGNWSHWLHPGETVNWPMEVNIARLAQGSV